MPVTPELAEARTCYDHLAGRLGVALYERLVSAGALVPPAAPGEREVALGPAAGTELAALGVDLAAIPKGRRRLAATCVDWTERRPHLAGPLGAAVLGAAFRDGCVARAEGRALTVTAEGRARLGQ